MVYSLLMMPMRVANSFGTGFLNLLRRLSEECEWDAIGMLILFVLNSSLAWLSPVAALDTLECNGEEVTRLLFAIWLSAAVSLP